jgi:recombination protein RecA
MAKKKADDYSDSAFDTEFSDIIVDPASLVAGSTLGSGSPKVDRLTNGGFRRGSISEVYGPPKSGKSTLAQSAAAQVLRGGGVVYYADLEWGLDIEPEQAYFLAGTANPDAAEIKAASEDGIRNWLGVNGVNPYNPNFHIIQPDTGERLWKAVNHLVRGGLADLVIVDSVAAITTSAEEEGEIGDSHYGTVAKLNTSALKTIARGFRYSRRTHVLLINQIRANIGSRHGGIKSTGGHALEHYVGMKLRVWRIGGATNESTGEVTTDSIVKVDKSRYCPQRQTTITISSKRGIDVPAELLEVGQELGYVHKLGSWLHFYDRPVEYRALKKEGKEKDKDSGYVETRQGESAAKDYLAESPLYTVLYKAAIT